MQLDCILEVYADSHPKEAKFVRPWKEPPISEPERLAAWSRVFIGKAERDMMDKIGPSKAVIKVLEDRKIRVASMKPTFQRGPGK